MAGPQRLTASKQPSESEGAGIFESDVVGAHRHRHLGLLGGHTEFGEHPAQRRIGPVVVHQKRGIDGDEIADWSVRVDDGVGVRVPAEPLIGFIQRHPVPPGQSVGGGEAGDTAADNGYRARV